MSSSISSQIKSKWESLSEGQRKLITILGAVDAAGKSLALASLARTDKPQVRGSKFIWGIAIGTVNTFGWLSWFAFGRKKGEGEPQPNQG